MTNTVRRITSTAALLPLIVSVLALSAPATPDDPLVLVPGVTDRGAEPDSWNLDLRDMTREEAEAAADGLSYRIYGSRDGALHQPLTLRTNFDHDVVLGLYVDAVCLCGAVFDIEIDGDFFHRLTWPRAGSTHHPETVYHFTVPAGDHTVSLEVDSSDAGGGPVNVRDYTFAASPDNFPDDRKQVKLEQEEPPPPPPEPNTPHPGYRGIWFTLGQQSEWGDKYSGGLGTYTMKHSPLAVYAPEVDRTFFTYGGTTTADETDLLIMAASYDHRRHRVTQPTIVDTKPGVADPHDNASIALDDDGHVWIFVSGRGQARPGFKYRSVQPYDVSEFERISTEEMTYPQPRHIEGQGFFNNFTKYTAGRELYWETSTDGVTWSEDRKLAGFGGHYQMTAERDGTVVTAFNYHPNGVDTRTNLYVAMTDDMGDTWTTVDGTALRTPLEHRDNPALVVDYEEQGLLNYNKDVALDAHGHPIVLHVTSHDYRPGPDGDPRTWRVSHWTGSQWVTRDITTSDHNYDAGSLYVDGETWTVYAPTGTGPQEYQTGGEMAIWESTDHGATWTERTRVTEGSRFNHTYARRPLDPHEPFFALWADGDPTQLSASRIYFGDSTGRYWQLPYTMQAEPATPLRQCRRPDDRAGVVVNGHETGVENRPAWGGCSINDVIEDDLDWRSHGLFVAHVTDVTKRLTDDGVIDAAERSAIIAASAAADGPADRAVRPVDWPSFDEGPPDSPDAERARQILLNTNRYALSTWYPSTYGGQSGDYLDLGGVGEHDVRPPGSAALALATSLSTGAYDARATGVPRDEALGTTVQLVRSIAHHHLANREAGWGEEWQSALWAYYAGYAGWLIWDHLDAADRENVQRMIEHEADRFIDYTVPYFRDAEGNVVHPGDSKAEENAWNANLLQLATAMMPEHPRHGLWMNKNLELMVSAFSRPADLANTEVVNGRQVRDWLNGSNIADDGTLVNHGFIHPDYMATLIHNSNAVLSYGMANQPTPEAALFNGDLVYDAMVDHEFASPPYQAPGGTIYVDGSADLYYPQGNDWGTHRRMHVALMDAQATAFGLDGQASTPGSVWEPLHASMVLDMQSRFDDGRTYGAPSEDTYAGREQWVATHAAQTWLTHWIVHQDAFRITERAVPERW